MQWRLRIVWTFWADPPIAEGHDLSGAYESEVRRVEEENRVAALQSAEGNMR